MQVLVGAVQYIVNGFFRQIADRSFESAAIAFAYGTYLCKYQRVLMLAQCHYSAVVNRYGIVRNQFLAVNDIHIAQSFALTACPQRRIKREIMWCRLPVRQSRYGVHKRLAVISSFSGFIIHNHKLAVALFECHVGSFTQTFVVLGRHL